MNTPTTSEFTFKKITFGQQRSTSTNRNYAIMYMYFNILVNKPEMCVRKCQFLSAQQHD